MTKTDLLIELDNEIARSREDWEEGHRLAPNSYGAGYDRGQLDAFMGIRDLIKAVEDTA